MYTITTGDGPEFEEGDEVVFTTGVFEGQTGIVAGYDEPNDVYFVAMDNQPFLITSAASMLGLLDEDDDDDTDEWDGWFVSGESEPEGPLRPGERVVVVYGHFIGSAGAVLTEDPAHSRPGRRVLVVVLDGGTKISIAEGSLDRSIYQGEVLEAVPSV